MRRRMQELAAGVYETEGPKVSLSVERIELEVEEGQELKKSFEIQSLNGISMRGIIYSDNPRMELLEAEFSGKKAVINYEFHTEGLVEGEVQKGKFYIICNKNEYTLSFVVSVRRKVFFFEELPIQNLERFTWLAQTDYQKAFHLFKTPSFENVMKHESNEIRLLARLLAYDMAPVHNLEEFLISTNQKKAIEYSCEYTDLRLENITQDIREIIEIRKEGWGLATFDVYTDADFIILQQNQYGMDDFIGNTCRIPYFISSHNLHKGYNYGRITIECGKQSFQYEIQVHQNSVRTVEPNIRKTLVELTRLYVDYRISKLMPALFASEALIRLDHLLALDEANVMLWLAKAQVLILSGRIQEAQWILDKQKSVLEKKNSVEYAYNLYVTTLISNERGYVRKVAEEIKQLYIQNQDNMFLFWMLLFVDESFANSKVRRYQGIKRFCLSYSTSPILYAEAYLLIKDKPELLGDFSKFEVQLINWAYKEELLSKELGLYLMESVRYSRTYYKLMTPILKWFYETWPQEEFLSELCFHLIAGQCYGKGYLPYYEVAIEKQLMIHGLYEAYIISAADAGMQEYPRMIQYYFQYKTNLSYRYKAFVYAGIIRNRDKQATLYLHCKPEIEQFALEQITLGHMDENLAQIYELYLSQITITHELARSLAPLLYIHKLTCNNKRLRKVLVAHKQLNKILSYPIIDGVAYFPIYCKDRVIAFEDDRLRRYARTEEYDLMMLLSPMALTRKCLKLAPEQMSYLIHYFDYSKLNESHIEEMSDVELGYLNIMMSSNAITDEYKLQLRPKLITYYSESGRTELLDEYLKSMEFSGLNQSIRVKACELLLERGFYEKAFQIVVEYGCHDITASHMLTLCSRMIELFEGEANDYLIGLCAMIFSKGKFNEDVLVYLSKYMYGATKTLHSLWLSAKDFGINTYELEERLLVQMLYTEEFVNNSEEIISSYINSGGKKLVLDAYVSYFAYQYFVKESIANTLAMGHLLFMYKHGERMHKCLKFSLLKWLTESKSSETAIMRELYDEFVLAGYAFQFFQLLQEEVKQHFPMPGKRIIEYRGLPNLNVHIRYLKSDYSDETLDETQYITKKMTEMYSGIYVKEVTLFYGDTLQYLIYEQDQIKCSGQISNRDIASKEDGNRYERLNTLIISEQLGEHARFEQRLERYDKLLEETKKELSWIK